MSKLAAETHAPSPCNPTAAGTPQGLDRRALLVASGAAAAGFAGAWWIRDRWHPRARVFVARNQRYDGPLVQTIRDGLVATGLEPAALRGRRVLLKPNLVEPIRTAPQMTTHPAVVVAAAEVFLGWGAEVIVGEAPGHLRDTELALVESGLGEALDDARLRFADMNYQQVAWTENRGRASRLAGFYFPQAVAEADLIVSLPKLKTHHWVGMTCSMKNLYGTLPGIKYGWPKNVLHHAGIPESVIDINASLPPTVAIVDGITCMEGDGPILGTAKPLGIVVVGTVPASVDATCARIMGFDPLKVTYLALAADRLGPVGDRWIDQVGERWQAVASPFAILDRPHLREILAAPTGRLTSEAVPRVGAAASA